MQSLARGLYTARLATGPQDMAESLRLRQICFRPGQSRSDADGHDAACRHILVRKADILVASFRLQIFAKGQTLSESYAAQFYDLSRLQTHPAPMIELGRFCLHPAHTDPDILRLAWASLTRIVDAHQATMLFGCSSFEGADPARHAAALGHLAQNHLGPETFRPTLRAGGIPLLSLPPPPQTPALPPLLRTYLTMGGWVSGHAVLDHDLNTTHVFTALEIAAIPPHRAKALRTLANMALAQTS